MASRLSSLTRKKKEVLQHSFSLVQQRLFTRIPTVQLSNQRDEKKEAKIYFFFSSLSFIVLMVAKRKRREPASKVLIYNNKKCIK
jgi:hypothetical protein